MDFVDTNKDGKVSRAEAHAGFIAGWALGVEAELIPATMAMPDYATRDAVFKSMDKDNNDFINGDELPALYEHLASHF